jgi:broad specificity phosphatase PhoE
MSSAPAASHGIHEQERQSLELLPGGKFEAAVARLFDQPEELVFGDETAAQALARFRDAVDRVLEGRRKGNIALVSHGRVISLYVADCTGVEPFPFWRRLGLPSFVVLCLPEQKVGEVVESVL